LQKVAVFWMLGIVVWYKFTDVSEVLDASKIKQMREDYTASTPETSVNSF
jgi:hypothetical protein